MRIDVIFNKEYNLNELINCIYDPFHKIQHDSNTKYIENNKLSNDN